MPGQEINASEWQSFYAHFHPQLPFLGSPRVLLLDCLACPLLFWAIIAVATRASPTLCGLRPQLVWPIRRLASESVLQPRSTQVVQALLLLSIWPMPYAALIDDPSWTFSGIATQKALQLGMYRPFSTLLQQARGDEEVAQRIQRTWITCVLVSQTYASSPFHHAPGIIILTEELGRASGLESHQPSRWNHR